MTTDLAQDIVAASTRTEYADGQSYRSLSAEKAARISELHCVSGRDVEISALRAGVVPQRYSRNMRTVSMADQATLLESRVSVVGLGGLGGGVVEVLARMGIGTLNLVDGDVFEQSNLNRQLLSAEDNLNESKVAVASKRIKSINSSVAVRGHMGYLSRANASDLLHGSEVIVDCLGQIEDRFVLEAAARQAERPLVSAAVAGLSGHVTTVFPEDAGLRLIYGEPEGLPRAGAEAGLGCLPQVTTMLAAVQCAEVTKILLTNKALLRNRMLAVDLQDNTYELVRLC